MERIIHFGFLTTVSIIIGMSLLLYGALSQSQESTLHLQQINNILQVTHQLRENYVKAELAARSYDATGNPVKLDDNKRLLRDLGRDIAALEPMLRNMPEQHRRQQQMAAVFVAMQDPVLDATLPNRPAGKEAGLMTEERRTFFQHVSDISNGTLRELNAYNTQSQRRIQGTLQALFGMVAFGLLILAPTYLNAIRQVRARKMAELQQKESSELLRLTVDSVEGMILYVDSNQRYKFHSKSYEQMFSRGGRPIDGVTVNEVLDRDAYGKVRGLIEQVLRGQPAHGEYRRSLPDGSIMDVRVSLTAHLNSAGLVQGFFGQITDITEYKRKEALLLEKTTFQKAVLDSARISIITTDCDGIVRSFNVGAERMLGYRADEVIGKATPALYHDEQESRERARELSAELGAPVTPGIGVYIAKASLGRVDEMESTYVRKDGSRLPVFLSITALRTDRGEIIGYLGIAFDITRQKESEAQLIQARAEAEAASRAKSAFLATMSHEIRTPMNGVLGMAEVLARSRLSAHQAEMVKTIRESAGVLLSLIDDILDFSKIEAGRFELDRTPVSIRDLAEGICTSLLPVAARKGVELDVFISPEIPERVMADDMRLRQLLYNLLGNAIKFSSGRPDKDGRVWLRAEVAQAEPLKIAFRVIDNGIGISAEAVDKLFFAFTQAESSTTRRFGGTGLGLAICKRLVELAHGEIRADSTPGVGSTFTAVLPLAPADEQPPPPFPDLGGLECIVVESPHLVAANLRAYLKPQGARVRIAADLGTAAAMAADIAPPVVVVQDAGDRQAAQRALQEAFAGISDVRHLLLTRGSRRQARIEAPHVVSLDADAMPRRNLLHAVTMVAGLAVPPLLSDHATGKKAAAAQAPEAAKARTGSGLILVAEDDPINQKVILRQLDLLGYAAEMADNGIEALRLWRKGKHALLLTDLHMPELDGYGLAMTIRAEEPQGRRLPILALSANALRGETGRAIAAGMDGYLTKPVQLDILQHALESWIPPIGTPVAPADPAIQDVGASSVVDIGVLKALVGDDDEAVHELLTEFHATARQQADELRRAVYEGDFGLAGSVAHKLKSSSRSVGALALGDACAELENTAKSGEKSAILSSMPKFEKAATAVKNTLAGLLAERNEKLARAGHENPRG
ncbi:PAS domain S-box protein [Janthinobacterium sp. 17J80-10]|uniref:PAS domain S-box protein n=1 Tax=Janthinobacterium sp. 17J80-10 TaxID=2497863 RepID=UPI0010059B0F|nr:PAS domain S-box protein [Janthinobacterium sp. 17J80-10]QAU32742.1 PAS domain S-box protein [Janthinobacterium sp. 17J80-10]